MIIEVFATVIAAISTLLIGVFATSDLIQKPVRRLLGIRKKPEKPYSERLAQLTASLTKASRELDSVLSELAQVARNREGAVKKLELDLGALETREKDLKENIEALENTPLPVAESFSRLLESREKRSVRRDYILFGSGVIVTTVVAIIIQVVTG
jgi:uncharacterized membrane-anchored protein